EDASHPLFLQQFQRAPFLGGGVVAGEPEGVVAVRVERCLGPAGDVGRVGVGEVLDDDAEGAARLVAELAGRAVGASAEPPGGFVADESELLDRGPNTVTGGFGHEIWPV